MKNIAKEEKKGNRKIIIAAILILTAAAVILFLTKGLSQKPTLSLEAPDGIGERDKDEFVVDVKLSDMGEAIYPAASIIVTFDKNRLEFTGVKMGNVMVYDNFNPEKQEGEGEMVIPLWNCNTDLSNRTGEIKAMYLDMTGGDNAYAAAGFKSGDQDTVLRLGFKLRDSVSAGDELKLEIADAVFAASGGDESGASLASADSLGTLRIKDTQIRVKQGK